MDKRFSAKMLMAQFSYHGGEPQFVGCGAGGNLSFYERQIDLEFFKVKEVRTDSKSGTITHYVVKYLVDDLSNFSAHWTDKKFPDLYLAAYFMNHMHIPSRKLYIDIYGEEE